MTKRTIRLVIISILTAISLVCSVILIISHLQKNRENAEYQRLQEELAAVKTETPPPSEAPTPTTTAEAPTKEPIPPTLLPLSVEYLELNPDYFGWINIPNTADDNYPQIDYPVVKTTDTDVDNPYLHMDFKRKQSSSGTIFASSQSQNPIILYGHHMKKGIMFAGLERFRDPAFCKTHRTINFTTLYEQKTYQLIAVYYFIDGTDINGDGYANYTDAYGADNPLPFLNFLKTYDKTFYLDETIPVSASSQFLTLQTCTYTDKSGKSIKDARLAIMAIEVEQPKTASN